MSGESGDGPVDEGPETRLAVYGSLAPGEANHRVLEPLSGRWLDGGRVRGVLHERGWGAGRGYPGLEPDPAGDPVPVKVFVSPELPDHWDRIDAFEGTDYRRVVVPVEGLPGGARRCNIYVVGDGARAGRGS